MLRDPLIRPLRPRTRWALRFLIAALLAASGIGAKHATARLQAEASSPFPVERTARYRPLLPNIEGMPLGDLASLEVPVVLEIQRGETLSGVFEELGLDDRQTSAAVEAARTHLDPRRLRAGNRYLAFLTGGTSVERVMFPLADRGRVWVERSGDEWQGRFEAYHIERREMRIAGVLDGALETSLRAAGAPVALAYQLADVFQWDLDFNRDLRTGDRFQVVFQSEWIEGELSRVGPIRAASYENRGLRYEGYQFGDEGGYYDAEGRPLRKQFLRSPLPFLRVTSGYTNRRFHPVLKVYRAHHGVDLGAPAGTPVRVTASGVVTLASWTSGGGGRTVKVRHTGEFETAYLHLSRFGDGMRPGRRVRQGEVIGYVGASGTATAPHLDYRVKHRGRYLDPMRLGGVPAPPLSEAQLASFMTVRDEVRRQLAANDTLASAHAPSPLQPAGP